MKQYGLYWINEATSEWYQSIYNKQNYIHDHFKNWADQRNLYSVFEVGAGIAQYSHFFSKIKYHAIDLTGLLSVDNPNHRAIHGDYMYYIPEEKYDLVFCHSVIDHVPKIEAFIKKMIRMSKKFVYITAYNGYFPDRVRHEQTWDENADCYFNELSVKSLDSFLKSLDIKYQITQLKSPRKNSTVIIIEV